MTYADTVKNTLNTVLDTCSANRDNLHNPAKDFIRDRKLSLKTMLKIIISMQGGSINKELFDYDSSIDVTSSAFVQQRDKIKPEMFYDILKAFNLACDDTKTYKGCKLLAVDGSDVNIAYNPDGDTYMPNGDNDNGFD